MDAFELLKADHKKVAELFDRLEAASGKAKLVVFKEIKSELDLHSHVEEKIFYPAIEKPQETHDLTLEAYEEHKVVKTLLAELAGAKTADDEWQAKAKVLRENVEHHVDEEDNELFDKADDVLSDDEVERLGNRMEAEKTRKQGRPAPKQPAPKSAKAGNGSKGEPGILSKIADFVGLGSDTANKRSSSKKAAARKGSKAGAKKKASKSSSKQSASGQGSKKASASRSGSSRKKTGSGSAKKAQKK